MRGQVFGVVQDEIFGDLARLGIKALAQVERPQFFEIAQRGLACGWINDRAISYS